MEEDLERALEALRRIHHWCNAYPIEVFPAPRNLDAVRAKIGDSEMARMHASWARHLLKGIGRVAKEGMQPSPGLPVDGPST